MVLQHVRQFVHQQGLFRADTRVVAALSGGSDSVALAALLQELDRAGDVRLVGAAHFNHGLRAEAGRDEATASAVAASLGIPFFAEREDVAIRARRERRSIEDAARASRYEFFERARRHFSADLVALGRTRDDQAETFLLRLLRGAGPRGLSSMFPRRDTVVRPLLECRRDELRAYLAERQLTFVEDDTNADVRIPRNRIRAELIPLLADRFNPSIVDVLAREAALVREIWEWLDRAAGALMEPARELEDGRLVCEIDERRLAAAPPPVRRLVVWRTLDEVGTKGAVAFRHVEAVLQLLEGVAPGPIDLPGQQVERVDGRVVLTGRPRGLAGRWRPQEPPGEQQASFKYSLPIPGEAHLDEAQCVISAELAEPGYEVGGAPASGRGLVALVRRDRCSDHLTVRSRRRGDVFHPVGLGGRKKLQDYFVDRKLARPLRDRVPIVVDETDRIVWVAGYGLDASFQVTNASQGVLLLRLKLLGGPA